MAPEMQEMPVQLWRLDHPDCRTVSSLVEAMAARRDGGARLPIDGLRTVARLCVAALPPSHPLFGVEVGGDPAVALVRLVATVSPWVRDLRVPDIANPGEIHLSETRTTELDHRRPRRERKEPATWRT